MASLKYLISNRAKFAFLSKSFFKAWGKRMMTLPELLKRNKRRQYLCSKGANIDSTVELSLIKANGNKKNLKIGAFSFIGTVEFALHEKITVGKNVCINDGVLILTASHNLDDPEWRHIKKPIFIDDFAWICTNAIILPGVNIGKGAVVGAGAVVSKNVLPYTIVVGNPATPIAKKRISNLTYNPTEFLAANLAWIKG
jgi:maltose O-acetyltransferase